MNDDNMMFCTKIKLFIRKTVLKVLLFQFLLAQTPVKLKNSQIYKKIVNFETTIII